MRKVILELILIMDIVLILTANSFFNTNPLNYASTLNFKEETSTRSNIEPSIRIFPDAPPSGVPICTSDGFKYGHAILNDGTGGAIIAWGDSRGDSIDIYAQRINSSGSVQWTSDGIPICTANGDQYYPQICTDGNGGAIIVWSDARNGYANMDIYIQRIDSSGSIKWTMNGKALCTANNIQNGPQICSDGAGGAIIAWQDDRGSDYDIYAQRIDSSGNIIWTNNGEAITTASDDQVSVKICNDMAGGAIIVWIDRSNANGDIYAQRIDSTGTVKWTANGEPIYIAGENWWLPYYDVCSDGSGGAIITWDDARVDTMDLEIYAQRIDSTGTVKWTANGEAVSTAIDPQWYPTICSDGVGGAIITWVDQRRIGAFDIYAQKIDSTGTNKWLVNGVPICTSCSLRLPQYPHPICSDGNGGAYITWSDNRLGYNKDNIYAQLVNSTGDLQWRDSGVVICRAVDIQEYPLICTNGSGGAIIAWQDQRDGYPNDHIYAQHLGGKDFYVDDGDDTDGDDIGVDEEDDNGDSNSLILESGEGLSFGWFDVVFDLAASPWGMATLAGTGLVTVAILLKKRR